MKTTLSFLFLAACTLLCACSTTHDQSLGGETNWLVRCSDDEGCDLGSCVCGVCTQSCSASSRCEGELEGMCAATKSGAGETLCADTAGSVPTAVCLPGCSSDDACGDAFSCMQGSCVPRADTTAPVGQPTDEPIDEGAQSPAEMVDDHAALWMQHAPDQYVVQTCTLGIEPPGCVRAAIDHGEVVSAEERIFDPSAPGWEAFDLQSNPIENPLDQMFDDVRAGEVKGCTVIKTVFSDDDGTILSYMTRCEDSSTGGRTMVCLEADTLDLTACAVVPDESSPGPLVTEPSPPPDPEPTLITGRGPQLEQLMQSEEAWNSLIADNADTYWYAEENCVASSTDGSVAVIQVENGVASVYDRQVISRSDCISSVNRYGDLAIQTMTELYAYCEQRLRYAAPNVTLTFDDDNVLVGCVVDDAADCNDACGDGFFLRSWSFGLVRDAGVNP